MTFDAGTVMSLFVDDAWSGDFKVVDSLDQANGVWLGLQSLGTGNIDGPGIAPDFIGVHVNSSELVWLQPGRGAPCQTFSWIPGAEFSQPFTNRGAIHYGSAQENWARWREMEK